MGWKDLMESEGFLRIPKQASSVTLTPSVAARRGIANSRKLKRTLIFNFIDQARAPSRGVASTDQHDKFMSDDLVLRFLKR